MDEFGSLLGMKNSLFRRVGNFLTGPAESLPFCGLLDSESEAGIANSLYFPCITGNFAGLETGSLETVPSATRSVSPEN
jgi:hypothetical protein